MDTISILIITMGHYSINLVYGVTVLVFCISSGHDLHLYPVSGKYFERSQSYGLIQRTRSYSSCALHIV